MNKKHINIYDAINSLPDELITPEIYQAAIKEANIKLLNILPAQYMTDENINYILDHSKQHYSFNTFDLASIPENARTQKVCDVAVSKSLNNYFKVPVEKRSVHMLGEIMGSAHKHLHYLPLVPEANWNTELALAGIKSIYSSASNSSSRYNGRFSYSSGTSDKKQEMKLIQILLAYVPGTLKTKTFYFSLFSTNMEVKHIDSLMPTKYKKKDYYVEVARKNIHAVPKNKLDYDIFKAALLSEKNSIYDFFDKDKQLKEPLFEIMNNTVADIIVTRDPGKMGELPQKFWKKKRLILALQHEKSGHNVKQIYRKFDINKFDDDICRAIAVKQEYECPQFPPHIWTQSFIDFCMENCQSYYWFKCMPMELQTQELVNTIIEASISKIMYVRGELITYDMAVKAYKEVDSWNGSHKLEEYIPKHYFEDFVFETGLPKEFFAGKTTYNNVREKRENYTYCEIGDCYIGFFVDKDGRNEMNRLIMTRRSPMSLKPTIVFSRMVGTFHKTWFEKMIADSDPQFEKPVPGKGLKGKQINPYLDVKQIETIEGTKIYAHSLLGMNVLFTAENSDYEYEAESLSGLKEQMSYMLRKQLKIHETATVDSMKENLIVRQEAV